MKLNQTYIASQMGVSPSYINQIVRTTKRPNWNRAKELAKITKTKPILWLEGSKEDIQKVFCKKDAAA